MNAEAGPGHHQGSPAFSSVSTSPSSCPARQCFAEPRANEGLSYQPGTTFRGLQSDCDPVTAAGLEEALKRKDAIIRVRNAQISALWDELHTRQPWTNALSGDAPINLATEAAVNASRKLLVIGINTVSALSGSHLPAPTAPALLFI